MKNSLKKITHITASTKQSLGATSAQFLHWYSMQSKRNKIAMPVIAVLVIAGVIKISLGGSDVSAETTVVNRKVTVASVSALSNSERDFPLVGTVTSVSEATIRSEASGRLTKVYKKLGDTVYAGGIIAEFENSGERASLLQAEGAYEQAKAARNIAGLNSGQAGSSLGDTKNQTVNTITSAYTTLDDAVRGKTDSSYSDPKFDQVKLLISIPDANLASSLETKRKNIESILVTRELKNKSITQSSDLVTELNTNLSEAQTVKSYLDDLYTAYSKALPDSKFTQASIDAGKASTQIARQSVAGTISGLVAARSTLSASMTANQVAGADDSTQSSGTLATSDAQVKQALGAYNAAFSRLEKTIIRSPITGTLNSLTIDTGDYIGSFTQVAIVSNNGALEVVALVTEDDAKRITVGSPVTINGTVSAIVTRIASAIDPTTKKIEVRIGIKDMKSGLINGQSVSISIIKNKQNVVANPNAPIIIPLSALKLTPYGANVFIVSATNTLISVPVKEGAILGEQIQILEGLQGSETIVTDARGLKESQVVEVSDK